MNKKARFTTNLFLGVAFFFGGVTPLTVMYTYDPLMIFHKPWGRNMTFHKDMRLQAAGIINNVDFDSVILGTSMLENTSSVEAGKLLGGTFVNISISAGNFFERSFLLDHLFRKKSKVRHVIYSLDSYSGKADNQNYPPEKFSYLYDRNPFNDFRAYTLKNFLKCGVVYSMKPKCVGENDSLDRPNAWYLRKTHAARFGGLDNWFSMKNSRQIKIAMQSISKAAARVRTGAVEAFDDEAKNEAIFKAKTYLDDYVLRFVRENPETKFHLIFPPYSRIRYARWRQLNHTQAYAHETLNLYLAELSTKLPNLYVYGFEDQDFVDNVANYKDTGHYHQDINSMMLMAIRDGKHLLRPETVEEYVKVSREKALEFDLLGLSERIDAYLSKN